ncbi:MAG: hypothetical protein ACRDNF_02305 [Streptosporangiaceae bacterium]
MPDSRPAAEDRTAPNVAVLDGMLERVTFCNPETGYIVIDETSMADVIGGVHQSP